MFEILKSLKFDECKKKYCQLNFNLQNNINNDTFCEIINCLNLYPDTFFVSIGQLFNLEFYFQLLA